MGHHLKGQQFDCLISEAFNTAFDSATITGAPDITSE
jgi:hypothetical protein